MIKSITRSIIVGTAISAIPLSCQSALIFQYDYNNIFGESTLETTFPHSPTITGTQVTEAAPVLFSSDVPAVHAGGFSGSQNKEGGIVEALKFILPETTKDYGTVTVSAWLKPTDASGIMTFFQTGSTFRIQRINADSVRCKFGGVNINGNVPLPVDEWTFFAVTYDGNEAVFYSRSENASEFTVETIDATDALTSGGGVNIFTAHPSNAGQSWDGLIDNIRLYDHVLSSSDVETDYNSTDVSIPESAHSTAILALILCIIFRVKTKRKKSANWLSS